MVKHVQRKGGVRLPHRVEGVEGMDCLKMDLEKAGEESK